MQREFRLKDINSDQSYTIEKPSTLIGRSPQCDIFIDSGLLSRHHASILLVDEDTVLIKDLESTNGTFVNSMRVTRSSRLEHSDVITIGDAKFIFIDSDLDQSDDSFGDMSGMAEGLGINQDATSNRTMVQSSIFKSLGLDPSTLNFSHAGDDDSLRDFSLGSSPGGKLDGNKVPAVFIVKSGRKKGAIIKLSLPAFSEKEWSVGRSQLCDVVLDDPTVSSSHAIIQWRDGQWSIEDCNSTNGIKLNGAEVIATSFQHDDVVSIGSIKLLFKTVEQDNI